MGAEDSVLVPRKHFVFLWQLEGFCLVKMVSQAERRTEGRYKVPVRHTAHRWPGQLR